MSNVGAVRHPSIRNRLARSLRWALPVVLTAGVLVLPPSAAPAQVGTPGSTPPSGFQTQGVKVVGYNNLGGQGLNAAVTVVGNTAVVATGYTATGTFSNSNVRIAAQNTGPPCVTVPAKVVDISDPANPVVTATIDMPAGQAIREVDSLRVSTPAFTGDLVAVAFVTCQMDFKSLLERGVVQPGTFAHRGIGYYDVSDPSKPRLLGRYFPDFDEQDPSAPPCGPGGDINCAQDAFSVRLARLRDGRIMSLTSRPDASQDATAASGDIRIVDVTDPTKPTQVSSWPQLGTSPEFVLNNGCYPRAGGRTADFSTDGTQLYVPFLDGGLFTIDIRDLANPKPIGNWKYPNDWLIEGNAAYATPLDVGNRKFSVVADEDWWWPTGSVRIDTPSGMAGIHNGCLGHWTIQDLTFKSQSFTKPGGQIPGQMVYVGRGCPARKAANGTLTPADVLLGNPAGKIAVAGDPPTGGQSGGGCPGVARQRRLEDAGAIAVVSFVTSATPESVSTFTTAFWPRLPVDQNGSPTGLYNGPNVQLKRDIGTALRNALCPTQAAATPVQNGACQPAQVVTGATVDLAGDWGGLRFIEVTDPAKPVEMATYKSPASRVMPPPDVRGIYSAGQPEVDGTRVYAAWNTDGLRILDLASGTPVEVGSFIPPDTVDPTATVMPKAFVTGVDYTARHIVVTDMNSGLWILEKPAPFGGRGYWVTSADGGVFALGDAPFFGSAGNLRLKSPIVGMAASPNGQGYWLVAADGGVFTYGNAAYRGSMGSARLNSPIVGMVPTPSGLGYWLAAADGGVFAFGDARFLGSMAGTKLASPIVGITNTPWGKGYRLVAADGGVFAFGDAGFYGSTGAIKLRSPIVGVRPTASGRGYHLAAADGGVFAFGDAPFSGSAAGTRLAAPVVGIESAPGTRGYWMVGSDGGVQALGAPFLGSLGGTQLNSKVVGMATVPR